MMEPLFNSSSLPYVHELGPDALCVLQEEAARQAGVKVHFRDDMPGVLAAPAMTVIPAGAFEMGAPIDEFGFSPEEGPQHYVFMEQPFAIGTYTITAAEYEVFREATDWYLRPDLIWARDTFPVMNIGIEDAQHYAHWLSEQTGQRYRLPTEAEWEYATRAGSLAAFAFGETASCREVHFNAAFPYEEARQNKRWWLPRCFPLAKALMVGSLKPNLWGLHDMHGNVWEFTSSPWTNNHLNHRRDGRTENNSSDWVVTKGGSWFDAAVRARSAARNPRLRSEIDVNLGFRLVRELG
ncbi:MAG: formylglycine-generating enzyme family protein [bacterium]